MNRQKIENYLWGRLSVEEAEAFERQIDEDESLAERVAAHRREQELISKVEEAYWLRQMQSWRVEMDTGQGPAEIESMHGRQKEGSKQVRANGNPIYRRIIPWSAAAAIALLLSLYLFLPAEASFAIGAEAVMPAQYSAVERSAETEKIAKSRLESLFLQGFGALQSGDYEAADNIFLHIQNDSAAQPWLIQAVEYNRALISYEQGEKDMALSQLKEISKDSFHRYNQRAKALLSRLPE